MLSFSDADFSSLSIHHVGNKQQDGPLVLSDRPIAITDPILPNLLMQYFLSPFRAVQEVYRLDHPTTNLRLNEVYHFAQSFFSGEAPDFHDLSKGICQHLYGVSNHPKIKGGEVYVVHIRNLQIEGTTADALGIFKSENKETYLKVFPQDGSFSLEYEQEAININKLDKGCLILNMEESAGYNVLVVDQTNRNQEAVYWKDDFLQVRVRNDAFRQTGNFLSVYKQFVHEKIDDVFELEKADKIDLLNRSMNYFREKETFIEQEFEDEVIGNPEASQLFREYRKQFETEFDEPIEDGFSIHENAVRKARSAYKSVLKLDKNFHIYIHGNRDYIERGFDEEKGLHYYKVFFEQEQ